MTNSVRFDFSGAAVLVTGGTSGIGHAIAERFSDAGADVIVTGTRASRDDYDVELASFEYRRCELADRRSIEELVGSIDRLDILVNNAGANFPGGRDEWQPDAFADALALNLAGPMRLTMGCEDHLRNSGLAGGASVVNLASMSAYRSVPIVPGYGAAKAGLISLTGDLANRWAAEGIRVNAVAPGVVETPMTAPMLSIPELYDPEIAHTPMGRLGQPDEIAGVVAFLCSAACGFVTGHTVAVDGGYLLR